MFQKSICLLFFAAIMTTGCRKKADPQPVKQQPSTFSPAVNMEFDNVVGSKKLGLDSVWYQNANGDSFTVHHYKYYISNIGFTSQDGTVWYQPESYYLIDESKPSSRFFTIEKIPVGHYTKLVFMIGVDSKRNTSGAQTGALDPANAMFWDWNSGYIMAKLEGNSPVVANSSKSFAFHIGGFSGQYATQRIVTLSLPEELVVDSTSSISTIILKSDVAEWFKTPQTIKLNSFNIIAAAGADAAMMADNYADMFSVDQIIKVME